MNTQSKPQITPDKQLLIEIGNYINQGINLGNYTAIPNNSLNSLAEQIQMLVKLKDVQIERLTAEKKRK